MNSLTKKERLTLALILFSIIIFVAVDLLTDSQEGVAWWHLLAESAIALVASIGLFFIFQDIYLLRHSLRDEKANFAKYKLEAEEWRKQSQKYIDGLSQAIDSQLTQWQLSASEKEVALLLLKGLSLKEIAEVRATTEKTARAHSISVYAKSNLSGRSELAAFFLEDLLLPLQSDKEKE